VSAESRTWSNVADDSDDLQRIRANADLVIETLGPRSGLEQFGFNAPSVEWVDGFIERQRLREDATPEFLEKMVSILGSFLGECIIRTYGGRWTFGEFGWGVHFDEKNAAYPFSKVQKQFDNGNGDSIYSFFRMIPLAIPHLASSHMQGTPMQNSTKTADLIARIWRFFRRKKDR
jgi:hypothetical protein